jgi:hypothetical protein
MHISYAMPWPLWPVSPEDKMGLLIWFSTSLLNALVSVCVTRRIPEENIAFKYLKLVLGVAHLAPVAYAHPGLAWRSYSTQVLLYTCCLLPFSGLSYLAATYGPSMDRMRSFARFLTTSLIEFIDTFSIRWVELPAEAQVQKSLVDKVWPFTHEESATVMLVWLGLSAAFITTLLIHPVPPPDLDSLEDVLPLARFLLARFFSPFAKLDFSSWTWTTPRVLVKCMDRMLDVYWKSFVLISLVSLISVVLGPDFLSTNGTPPAPVEDDKEDYDINKEQWVIDLRAKASTEEATRRALKSAKSQMEWYSAAYDAQRLQLDQHTKTTDAQQKAIRTITATRERQSQTLASVKTQLAALEEKDKASTKLKAQFIGEKQHLLDALTNSQHAMRGAKGTLRLRDLEIDGLKAQLASCKLQESIAADQKALSKSREVYNERRLDEALKQVKATKEKLETSEATSATRLGYAHKLNARLDVINKAFLQADMPVSVYIISQENLVAKLTLPKYSDVQQEAKLAESCAELSAANETLKRDLSACETKLAETSTSLETSKTETEAAQNELKSATNKQHLAFQTWQQELRKAAHALSAAKLAHPSLPLKTQIAALEIKLTTALADNKKTRDLLFHQKYKASEYSYLLTEQIQKTKSARESLEQYVRANSELRETLETRSKRVKDLENRVEAGDDDRHCHLKEIQRLAGLLQVQEDAVLALEQTNEKLEKELVLGEEFDEVTGWDVPLPSELAREREEVEDGVVVWEEDGQEFGESFVEGFEESFEEEFEEVDGEEACEEGEESGDQAQDVKVQ